MAEYAPSEMMTVAKAIVKAVPGSEFSGIIGDQNHTYGYHRSRNRLLAAGKTGDYSIQYSFDKQGDGDAASGIDIKMTPTGMKTTTSRLLKAAQARDPRLEALREFFGTLDGKKVRGYDLATHRDSNNADDTHLWHIHLSIKRRYTRNSTALNLILAVIRGDELMSAKDVWAYNLNHTDTTHQIDWWEDEKSKTASSWLRAAAYHAAWARKNSSTNNDLLEKLVDEVQTNRTEVIAMAAQVTELRAEVAALREQLPDN